MDALVVDENYISVENEAGNAPSRTPTLAKYEAPPSPEKAVTAEDYIPPNTAIWIPSPTEGYVEGFTTANEGIKKGRAGVVKLSANNVDCPIAGTISKLVERRERNEHEAEATSRLDDLSTLNEMNNGSVLHALRLRHRNGLIYTRIGRTVLISVNPFTEIPELYSAARREMYTYTPPSSRTTKTRFEDTNNNNNVEEEQDVLAETGKGGGLPLPHVYQVALQAYRSAVDFGKRQSIIFSGESGSGKTEATKILLSHLVYQSQLQDAHSPAPAHVRERLLTANPLIEAFGNAKTVRNSNSSRFGAWTELVLDRVSRTITAAHVTSYLLEKSRVVCHDAAAGERTFHILYQVAAAFPELRGSKFLGTSNPGAKDAEAYSRTLALMATMNIPPSAVERSVEILRAILLLGEIEFAAISKHQETGEEASVVANPDTLAAAAEKGWGGHVGELEEALLRRDMSTARETILKPNSKRQAEEARDVLAKHLYGRVFEWIVGRVNDSLGGGGAAKTTTTTTTIVGMLDTFGFEVFPHNSFEQLCINYCNEKLQNHFNAACIAMERALYEAEGVSVLPAGRVGGFQNNEPVIELIEGGILQAIDDEIRIPQGSDANLLRRLRDRYVKANHPHFHPYISELKDPNARSLFGVKHFAGSVFYNVEGFLDKNRDALPPRLESLCRLAAESLVGERTAIATTTGGAARAHQKTTLGRRFNESLNELMREKIAHTETHFVRCIKPNDADAPALFDGALVLSQLRYGGVLESCIVRKSGFPVRRAHKQFLSQFAALAPRAARTEGLEGLVRELNRLYFTSTGSDFPHHASDAGLIAVGKSTVFLRAAHFNRLQEELERATGAKAARIQAAFRGFAERKRHAGRVKVMRSLDAAVKALDDVRIDHVLSSREMAALGRVENGLLRTAFQVSSELKDERAAEAELKFALETAKRCWTTEETGPVDLAHLRSVLSAAVETGKGCEHDLRGTLGELTRAARGELARVEEVENFLRALSTRETSKMFPSLSIASQELALIPRYRTIRFKSEKDNESLRRAREWQVAEGARVLQRAVRVRIIMSRRLKNGYLRLRAAIEEKDYEGIRALLASRKAGNGALTTKNARILRAAEKILLGYDKARLEATVRLDEAVNRARARLLRPEQGDWIDLKRAITAAASGGTVSREKLAEANAVLKQLAEALERMGSAAGRKKRSFWSRLFSCAACGGASGDYDEMGGHEGGMREMRG